MAFTEHPKESNVPSMSEPVLSLFTGAMGLDLGLEQVGIRSTLTVEVDAHCCATMRRNRPDLDVWETDVNGLDGSALVARLGNPKDVFLMVGGPPCQSFCSGGKRAGLSDPHDTIYDLRNHPGPHSKYTPEVAKYFEMIPPGGNWRDLPKQLQRDALGEASLAAGGGKTGFYRRLAWNAPSPTVTGRANRKGSALCHPEAIRPLSVRECARLQGFPDDWTFVGSMNRQYLQVGNAVPVPLGVAIGRAILAAVDGPRQGPQQNAFDLEHALVIATKKLRATARNKVSAKDSPDDGPSLF